MNLSRNTLHILLILTPFVCPAQEVSQYDRYQLLEGELYWQNKYDCEGDADSVRSVVEQMLQSRLFTFDVVRGKEGYSGKINHYGVHPKQYGRTYLNTPKMYWDGEWSGKFVVEVYAGYYLVTVYALNFKTETQPVGHYKPAETRFGPYIDVVTNNNRQSFLKNEFQNLTLMSVSLKDNFDYRYVVPPVGK